MHELIHIVNCGSTPVAAFSDEDEAVAYMKFHDARCLAIHSVSPKMSIWPAAHLALERVLSEQESAELENFLQQYRNNPQENRNEH